MKSVETRVTALEKHVPNTSLFDDLVAALNGAAGRSPEVADRPSDDEAARWTALFPTDQRFASFLAWTAAETSDGVFALERLRGCLPDELLRLAYKSVGNWAFSDEDRKRVLRSAGVLDENDELRHGHSWVRGEKWGLVAETEHPMTCAAASETSPS